MATEDYNKLKKDELEKLCESRGLSTKGLKKDLVQRLKEADEAAPAQADSSAEAPPTAAAAAQSSASAQAPEKSAQPPSTASDAKTSEAPVAATAAKTDTASEPAAAAAANGADAAPAKDYAAHLPQTHLTDELERRKARAARFGLGGGEEIDKELSRAKRFGLETPPAPGSGLAVGGLNEALPEEGKRKRGREATDGRPPKRQDSRQRAGKPGSKAKPAALNDADRARAEARAKRFAAAG